MLEARLPLLRKWASIRSREQVAHWLETTLALVFVLSAVSKALDVEAFAVQLSYYEIVREPRVVWATALAVVCIETALAVLLMQGGPLRMWTLGTTLLLLAGFTGLIAYAWAFKGLSECGCFGRFLLMSPGMSIIKNVVMMTFAGAALYVCAGDKGRVGLSETPALVRRLPGRPVAAVMSVVVVAGVSTYGILQRAEGNVAIQRHSGPVEKDRPLAQFRFDHKGTTWDLGKGSYLVAFLSTSCDHCERDMQTLNDLALIPQFPRVAALMLGDEETLQALLARNQPEFPTILIEPLTFFQFIGEAPPRVYYIVDGRPVQYWDGEPPAIADVLALVSGIADRGARVK